MLTTFNDEEYILRALSYGANGYLLKDIQADILLEAIRKSVSGNLYMTAPVAAKLSSGLSSIYNSAGTSGGGSNTGENRFSAKESSMGQVTFSAREKEIAELIEKGLSNREIAARLFLSEGTVKNYISEIYAKMEVRDRRNAITEIRFSRSLPGK